MRGRIKCHTTRTDLPLDGAYELPYADTVTSCTYLLVDRTASPCSARPCSPVVLVVGPSDAVHRHRRRSGCCASTARTLKAAYNCNVTEVVQLSPTSRLTPSGINLPSPARTTKLYKPRTVRWHYIWTSTLPPSHVHSGSRAVKEGYVKCTRPGLVVARFTDGDIPVLFINPVLSTS